MAEEKTASAKPKVLIIDRKFGPQDLKIKSNLEYMRDLGQCFKIFQKWGFDIVWVENGIDAMRALREYRDDMNCVLLEAYIPGGGFTVARLIRFKHDCTHIPVFLMSSQLTPKDLEESRRIGIFDSLARPFQDPVFLENRLKKGVESSSEIPEDIDPQEHILNELEKITDLPAMPNVLGEIDELSRDPEATTEQYSKVIELDPAITAQMLRLSNSSAFGFSRRITSVIDAVNLLGLQTVIDFVRTLSVVGAFKGEAVVFDTQEFWRHSIACGVAAKLMVDHQAFKQKIRIGEDDPFMAGMVHDIGKQVLGHFFSEMFKMVLDEMRGGKAMLDVERDVLGITHADIGAALAGKWELPDVLVQVIGFHHTPGIVESNTDMVHLIHLSNIFSKGLGFGFEERPKQVDPSEQTLEWVGMDSDAISTVFKELEMTIRRQVAETFSAIFG